MCVCVISNNSFSDSSMTCSMSFSPSVLISAIAVPAVCRRRRVYAS